MTEERVKRSYTHEKTEGGMYKSRLRASQKYDAENVYSVRLRVPIDWKDKLKDYIEGSEDYSSLNQMICTLISREIGEAYPVPPKKDDVDSKE